MFYALVGQDVPDSLERRLAARPAHLERLQALQQVNPSIRDEELDFLRHRIDECAIHIQHANLQLQALRLVITT
jgi:ATP-dependent helicase HepA